MRRPPLLLALLSLVGLMGATACSDNRVATLGQRVVSLLKADPAVASVGYGYESPAAIDAPYEPPYLAFFIHLKPGRQDIADAKPLIRSAAEIVWQTPAKLKSLVMEFSPAVLSSAPEDQAPADLFQVVVPMSSTPAPKERAADAQESALRDFVHALQQELQATYGPHKTS
ncbi:hypothetical protein Srot_1719 [Segniliparus rotundus DSM 44985]|uniref:Lipoprotein n=1 Tax=Segniliparus rotundus (strain ATCC BAA-972 / CDC 1076 / CIP 108378 / DSM 44985 / JCM 13578) TaxID=640132 RepID=D6Z899_SEGRD|nr:hypothetical protein [Segniliparus rotundus]ADG98179.1 hypothetical protein Srot_1719 [Segniliparus rotundus DSM 44985]